MRMNLSCIWNPRQIQSPMKISLGIFGRAFLNLIYPPLCLHCKATPESDSNLLCSNCLALLQLIDPSERCPHCFSASYSPEHHLCSECKRKPPILNGVGASFDYVGPAGSLVKKLKYSDQPYLAKGCAAYMAMQFLRLDWPLPDLIVPVPIAFTHLMTRGYNQSLLLSQELSLILDKPVQEVLVRKSGDFSQAGLTRKQRLKLEGTRFQLKSKLKTIESLEEKTILLVDDVMTTGSTMQKCAEAMMEGFPSKLYSLAVCRAIK